LSTFLGKNCIFLQKKPEKRHFSENEPVAGGRERGEGGNSPGWKEE
jgi:hypothetical protein